MQAYTWMIRGFKGVVATLESATNMKIAMSAEEIQELQGWIDRLTKIVSAQKANFPLPTPPSEPQKPPVGT